MIAVLPETVVLPLSPWPDCEGEEMQFRLVYQGPLKAQTSTEGRIKEKHAIRRMLHLQLREFWNTHPSLRSLSKYFPEYASRYERCGYRCIPLVGDVFSESRMTACALDILFLRRDVPGNLIRSGGDIDNRIKVLFDALRMPENCDEVRNMPPQSDEDPFFCLLQNDNLITEVKVTTDRLLSPLSDGEHIHNVYLVIHVKTQLVGSGGGVSALNA